MRGQQQAADVEAAPEEGAVTDVDWNGIVGGELREIFGVLDEGGAKRRLLDAAREDVQGRGAERGTGVEPALFACRHLSLPHPGELESLLGNGSWKVAVGIAECCGRIPVGHSERVAQPRLNATAPAREYPRIVHRKNSVETCRGSEVLCRQVLERLHLALRHPKH